MFFVVEFNQASGRPMPTAELFDDMGDAIAHRNELRDEAKASGRGEHYRIFTGEELDEADEWEWGVRHGGHTIPTLDSGTRPVSVTTYISQRAARRGCARGDVLVRRYAGGDWEEVIDV